MFMRLNPVIDECTVTKLEELTEEQKKQVQNMKDRELMFNDQSWD